MQSFKGIFTMLQNIFLCFNSDDNKEYDCLYLIFSREAKFMKFYLIVLVRDKGWET